MSFNYFITFPRELLEDSDLYKFFQKIYFDFGQIDSKKVAKKAFRNKHIYDFGGGGYGGWHENASYHLQLMDGYKNKLEELCDMIETELKVGEFVEIYRQWGGIEKVTMHMTPYQVQKYYRDRLIGLATQKLTIDLEEFINGSYPYQFDERYMLIVVKG